MLRARVLKADGKSEFDTFGISEDEKSIFKKFLSKGTHRVFSQFFKFAQGVSDSIFTDATYTKGDASTVANCYGGSVANNAAYNDNVLPVINGYIEDCLIQFVLYNWWQHSGIETDYKNARGEYSLLLGELTEKTQQLRRKLV